MVVVDTNVVVRLLVRDDDAQTALAKDLFATEYIWIPITVLLETEWVLRVAYNFDRQAIHRALTGLLGVEKVMVENPETAALALHFTAGGIDFADALHLASRPPNTRLLTFDRELIRRAKRAGQSAISSLPA